ncbi:CubicO group peptidase (beta-lactamase class C family) [Bradyrhizobium sp. GM24.11]
MCEFVQTVRKEGAHGVAFNYKGPNAGVMAWAMERVTGRSFAQLLHQRLWVPLGCEEDGYLSVDATGMAVAGGGLCGTVRDMARFGELMRREGEWNGRQLIPASVVDEVQKGDDPAKLSSALLPGYSYKGMWWVSHNELGAFEGRGVFGQRLYIAPKAEMVVARFSSHPVATNAANDEITLPQMLALGRMLRS